MAACRIKRGFFLLRDCGLDAVRDCSVCGRGACDEHGADRDGAWTCNDCHARAAETEPDPNDPGWTARYRDGYYTASSYAPFYVGHQYDSYYDDYDVRAFAADMLDAPELGDDADGDFFDS